MLAVVLAHVVGGDPPLGPDGAQQRARQRTGAGAGLQHARAREDVALVHDLGGVLRVDDLRAAGHRHHVVDQQRPQHQELVAVGGLDHAALGQADHGVERDDPAMGVELPAGRQQHRVVPALRVGELHAITDGERTGPVAQQFSLPVDAPRRVRGVVGASPYSGLMTDEPEPTAVRRPALSPSRAADFKQCPLLYRFRAIDRLPEPSSTAQVRGSVVHAALEQLYALARRRARSPIPR